MTVIHGVKGVRCRLDVWLRPIGQVSQRNRDLEGKILCPEGHRMAQRISANAPVAFIGSRHEESFPGRNRDSKRPRSWTGACLRGQESV